MDGDDCAQGFDGAQAAAIAGDGVVGFAGLDVRCVEAETGGGNIACRLGEQPIATRQRDGRGDRHGLVVWSNGVALRWRVKRRKCLRMSTRTVIH